MPYINRSEDGSSQSKHVAPDSISKVCT